MTASKRAGELAIIAAQAVSDKLGTEIMALDVSEHLPLSDVFVVCSGRNERMVQAIADEVDRTLTEAGSPPLREEGRSLGRWALLDCGEIIVHIFHEEERLFYQLERLWRDSPVIELPVMDSVTEAKESL
jgi:ribosome-associated protein